MVLCVCIDIHFWRSFSASVPPLDATAARSTLLNIRNQQYKGWSFAPLIHPSAHLPCTDMSAPIDLPDLTPEGLINDEGNYILQDVDISNLMAYVWTGVLLATDKGKYMLRLGITSDQFDKVRTRMQL